MIEILDKSKCSGCYACLNICPKRCISMKVDEEGFWYPVIDKEKCIKCNMCEKVCSIYNELNTISDEIIAYACKNKNEKIRKASSSGGIFSLLCEQVTKNGGVVFGAAFNENFEVEHIYAETLQECSKFRESKYVQSKIGNTYKQVKEFLEDGRLVLFSGTPCQISSLDLFLMKKKYDNLIMVDIACHGVPSPLVYKKYIQLLEEKNQSKISKVSFRNKITGWKNYSVKFDLINGNSINEIGYNNIYMKGFLSDIYLRPSCYECRSKKPISSADITLADYWGIENIHKDFDDDRGVSLVLANTQKGQCLLDKISSNMEIIGTDFQYAVSCNPSIVRAANINTKREKFFKDINKVNIEKNIYKYTKISIINKVKRKISILFNRIASKKFFIG